MLQAKKEEFSLPKKLTNKYNLPLNERLREARKKKKINTIAQMHRELAKRNVNVGQSTLQGYEANESSLNHRYPSLYMLLEIADLLDCSIDYLLGRSDEINTPTKDVKKILSNHSDLRWGDKVINQEERNMIIYKANVLMSL